MKTIFAVFPNYADADSAVDALLNVDDLEEKDVNVLIQAEVADEAMAVNRRTIDVEATDEVGLKEVRGLKAIVGKQQPVPVGGTGEVYAAGTLATLAAKDAAASTDLAKALSDLGVDGSAAQHYSEAVGGGDWLIWVRVDDGDAGTTANLFRDHKANQVAHHA